jgi:hypothetical protein
MFNAIFVRAFERLHRVKQREDLLNGKQGGFVIGFCQGDVHIVSVLIVAEHSWLQIDGRI